METLASVMEMLMVICFGISWPLNIIKAWKVRTAKGISLPFYFFIWIGYVFALVGKIIRIVCGLGTVPFYLMFFYVLNTLMVTGGIAIYFRNRALDRKAGKD